MLCACAGAVFEPQAGSPGPRARVVVAPLNLGLELTPDLEDVVEPVRREIIRHLLARDLRVAVVEPEDARWLWADTLNGVRRASGVPNTLEAVAGRFASRLAEIEEFHSLILPSVALRKANVRGLTASWDGVRRRVAQRGEASPYLETGIEELAGLSLHVLVLTPSGRIAYQGWGGLDLAQDVARPRGVRPGPAILLPTARLLESRKDLTEGVAVALGPYLGTSAR